MLLTGGSGRLGQELQQLLPELIAPPRAQLDICQPESLRAVLEPLQPSLCIHAAAYTDVKAAEQDKRACWQVNVEGSRQLLLALQRYSPNTFLIHISTDYVFAGDQGNYAEDDPLGPVRNYYALSKLVAEEIVRSYPQHLVIRTSFRPRQWPYPQAFDDVYTSQDYVDIIAPDIALAVRQHRAIPYDTLHIATARKSVYALAQQRAPQVQRGSKAAAGVDLPDDISLDISRWQALKAAWEKVADSA